MRSIKRNRFADVFTSAPCESTICFVLQWPLPSLKSIFMCCWTAQKGWKAPFKRSHASARIEARFVFLGASDALVLRACWTLLV